MSASTARQMEEIEYLSANLSGETPESRAMISRLEVACEFVGFGGHWQSSALEPLREGEQRKFFTTPKEIIAYYGSDEAQSLLDTNKFVTQLLHDGRWAVTIRPMTAEDYARDAEAK